MALSVLKAWARDYKRSMALALGVIMSIALFTGMNVNIDASSVELLNAILSNVIADALAYRIGPLAEGVPEGGWLSVEDALRGVDGVLDVETIMLLPFKPGANVGLEVNGAPVDLGEATGNYTEAIYITGLSDDLREKVEMKVISGSWNLTGHGILVSAALAGPLGLEVGDEVVVVGNFTFMGHTITWRSPGLEVRGVLYLGEDAVSLLRAWPMRQLTWMTALRAPLVMCMSYETFEDLLASFPGGLDAIDIAIFYYVWANREALIDPWNLDATQENLNRFEMDLWSKAEEYGLDLVVYLSYAIRAFSQALSGIRVMTGALSFPVFLLCWYLVLTAGYLISGARRREVGLLKVRGASSKSIFISYMLTALSLIHI